jgi:hypothetical protein
MEDQRKSLILDNPTVDKGPSGGDFHKDDFSMELDGRMDKCICEFPRSNLENLGTDGKGSQET